MDDASPEQVEAAAPADLSEDLDRLAVVEAELAAAEAELEALEDAGDTAEAESG